jgi:hypothetical protein
MITDGCVAFEQWAGVDLAYKRMCLLPTETERQAK